MAPAGEIALTEPVGQATSVKLERADWIKAFGGACTIAAAVVAMLFYLLTPQQEHDADISILKGQVDVHIAKQEVKEDHLTKTLKIIGRQVTGIAKKQQELHVQQQVMMTKDERRAAKSLAASLDMDDFPSP